MDPDIQMILEMTQGSMDSAIDYFRNALVKIRAGKASVSMVDGVMVDYYGSPTPLNQVANVSVSDARTLTITPWEKNMIPVIEKAIRDGNLGFNPQSDGDMVRIPIPMLTEERRKDLVKQAKSEAENARIALRKARQDANSELKDLQKEGTSEDAVKEGEKKVQDITNDYNGKVEAIMKEKESQIMTV
ncbi:MAG: ribosome recycling factor [Bacteroidota bacterium]